MDQIDDETKQRFEDEHHFNVKILILVIFIFVLFFSAVVVLRNYIF